MDCITCHNRITHLVPNPEDTVDHLIARGMISKAIPEIRLKAIEVYSKLHSSSQAGLNGIAGLEGYYQDYHPDYYAAHKDEISRAIAALQEAYRSSVFPEQNSSWETHPNNVGHKNSPGCFRCHDGEHLDQEKNAIRLECNLCHSIPISASGTDFVTDIEISRGPEPESHHNTNWIILHRQVYNSTCSNCHTTSNPGGVDNSSFCSNSACHGSSWTFAGFDAPALRNAIQAQLPPTPTAMPVPAGGQPTFDNAIGAIFTTRCGQCHGENGSKGLSLTGFASTIKGGTDGAVIVPGKPEESLIVKVQSGSSPHFGQLSQEELALLVQWIQDGAPEN
jgi:mono/diheme cytochrome c family protein